MARRAKKKWGEGSVYEHPEGSGKWYAQLPPDARGRRPKRRASSEAEAYGKLRELNEQRKKRIRLDKNPTIAQLYDAYIADLEASGDVKASTLASYRQIGRLYIVPQLGMLRARDTLPSDIRDWRNTLQQTYAADTVKNAVARLHAAFELAIDDRLVEINPVTARRRRRKKATAASAPARHVPSLDEARRMRDAVAGHRIALLYDVLMTLGLRKGETLGLQWFDLDWEAGTLHIRRQVQTIEGKTGFSPTTKNSEERLLPVPPMLLSGFRAQWAMLQEERRVADDWEEHMLIFPSERGTPIGPRNLNRHHDSALDRAKLPAATCVHSWRHFVSTRLDELGITEAVRAAILGHSSGKSVTGRYTHATLDTMRAALTQLETTILRRAA